MHYLKSDPVFSLMQLKESSCSHGLLHSFRICPLSVLLPYFFDTPQRKATRRQTQSKIEQQDSSLLITPHLCVQPLQKHVEATFSLSISKFLSLVCKQKVCIIYADPRISIPLSKSSESLSF